MSSAESLLPKYAREKLVKKLKTFTPKSSALRNILNEDGIRVAFLQMMVDLMRDYRGSVQWTNNQFMFDRVLYCEKHADYEVSSTFFAPVYPSVYKQIWLKCVDYVT